jgi:hypothetical protein
MVEAVVTARSMPLPMLLFLLLFEERAADELSVPSSPMGVQVDGCCCCGVDSSLTRLREDEAEGGSGGAGRRRRCCSLMATRVCLDGSGRHGKGEGDSKQAIKLHRAAGT